MISFSFVWTSASISATNLSVIFCTWSLPRRPSSSVIFPSRWACLISSCAFLAHVAHGDAAVLGPLFHDLDQLFAALFVERRQDQADVPPSTLGVMPSRSSRSPCGCRRRSLCRGGDTTSVRASGIAIVAQLLERHLRAVASTSTVEQRRRSRGPCGSTANSPRVARRLVHARFEVFDTTRAACPSCALPTNVPIGSPQMTRRMLPSRIVEDDDRQAVVHAQRQRGVVHHFEPALQHFHIVERRRSVSRSGPSSDRRV